MVDLKFQLYAAEEKNLPMVLGGVNYKREPG